MSEENVEIVRGVYAAAARNDLDAAAAYIHPEVEFHTYAESPRGGRLSRPGGRAEVQRGPVRTIRERRFELEEVLDAGERVVVVSTQHAVPKGGRQEMSVRVDGGLDDP